MHASKPRIDSKPLLVSGRIWLLGWLVVIAAIVLGDVGVGIGLIAFLPFHWLACWFLSRAALEFGRNPWRFGAIPAILPPLYLNLLNALRQEAWQAARTRVA
ncbi:MAG TPA: hypothetical protein VJ806_04760 [Luteimonas sp.]|nr:hypothetical protein [Luteimonas sp.]